MFSDYVNFMSKPKEAYEESYHDVSAWCPRHQVGQKTVAELAKDKLNPDVSALVISAVGRLRDEHLPPNLTPQHLEVSAFEHWKKINVDEDYEYALETHLDANRRSVNSARSINYSNRKKIEFENACDSEEEADYESEEENLCESEEKNCHESDEEDGYDSDDEECRLLKTPYAKYTREFDMRYDPYDHRPATHESELECRFTLGYPLDPLPHFQIHPILGFAYL